MINKNKVQDIILQALKNINDERGSHEQIEIGFDTRLFGADAVLDSLALVSVIVDVEAAVSDASGRDISLTDDRAMSQAVSPFSDVSTLRDYIVLLLSEAN
jgi:acyl carrier protein